MFYKKLSNPPKLKLKLDKIVEELETHGRSINNEPNVIQVFAQNVRIPKQKGDIRFAKDFKSKETIIVIPLEKKLVRINDLKFKIYKKWC